MVPIRTISRPSDFATGSGEPDIDLDAASGPSALAARIQCRLGGQLRDFRVALVNGGLLLRGRARTYYAKQLAQHAVMQATQRPILANEIEVA